MKEITSNTIGRPPWRDVLATAGMVVVCAAIVVIALWAVVFS